ncbi:MAG: FKBP-type peptidyl-prolyl cis-trans isomerase [Clostridiales bacterium]|nr:FKBP-type peptidyl-prolyl cis-trans isomerase [Clostridiales bacterium]
MNKENKKKAQQERAKAREKAQRKKRRNDLLKTWVPIVVVIIVVVIIIAAIVMSRNESSSGGNFYEDGSEYGIIAEDGEDYEDDDDFDEDEDDLWLDTEEGYVVEEGDTVNIDYTGYLDGEAFDGGSTNGAGADLTLGSGTYIDGFEDGIIGHEVGETFDIDVTFPEDYGVESLNGQAVVFTITINGVYD